MARTSRSPACTKKVSKVSYEKSFRIRRPRQGAVHGSGGALFRQYEQNANDQKSKKEDRVLRIYRRINSSKYCWLTKIATV